MSRDFWISSIDDIKRNVVVVSSFSDQNDESITVFTDRPNWAVAVDLFIKIKQSVPFFLDFLVQKALSFKNVFWI